MAAGMPRSVVVAAARTPVGKYGGMFRRVPAIDLGATAIRAVIGRAAAAAGMDDETVAGHLDYVLMGHVLQAGLGQNTARQAAVAAGVPVQCPAMTLNKVCLASLSAIALADQLIRAGDIDMAVAGGMESMSTAPHVLFGHRFGARPGNAELVDAVISDGLWSSFHDKHMGELSDEVNDELGISRQEQDAWAARSHRRAAEAASSGRFDAEVEAVETAGLAGPPEDEGIRPETTVEQLAKLAPAFRPSGTITAGNASQLSDGAAAVLVMRKDRAESMGIPALVEIVAHGMSAEEFPYLHTVPALALQRALDRLGRQAPTLDLVEINEAFASVAVHSTRMLGLDETDVNVNGGSVALGHALGSTGARMTVSLVHEMCRRQVETGAVTLCGGGGQGEALVLRRPDG